MVSKGSEFLGTGWAFPVAVDDAGRIGQASLEASIKQSIRLIIGTAKGDRIMHPAFGCGMHDLVFSPLDTTTAALVSYEVREALIEWEPRIQLLDIQVTPDPVEANKLLIDLKYRVRTTNNTFNLVYPFYLDRSGI